MWIVVQLLSFAPKLTLFLLLLVIFGQCRAWRISDLYLGQLGGIAGEKTLTVLLLTKSSIRGRYFVCCECRNMKWEPTWRLQSSGRFGRTNQVSKVLHITSYFTELELYFKPIECLLLFAMLSAWPEDHYLHTEGLPEAPWGGASFSFTLPSFAAAALRGRSFKLKVSSLQLQPQWEVVSIWHCWNQQPVWEDLGVLCSCGQKAAGSAAEATAWDALAQQLAAADAGGRCKVLLCQQSLLLETWLMLAGFALWCTLSPS